MNDDTNIEVEVTDTPETETVIETPAEATPDVPAEATSTEATPEPTA